MSVKVLTVSEVDKSGIVDIGADANAVAGNVATDIYMPNDGRTTLIVDGTTGDTWTFTAVADKYGRTETLTFVVAAGKWGIVGPFLPELWNDSDGYIHFVPTAGNAGDTLLAVRVANPT